VLRVLIVDDYRDGADTLADLVRMWGHEVRVAYDGPAGLRSADTFRPGVFLLDIGLPGMDGCCLARLLRRQVAFRDALVIAVTGQGDPPHRGPEEEADFDDYLLKPVDLTALREMLARRVADEHPAQRLPC
jgi:CheY-like chemotaxis protein